MLDRNRRSVRLTPAGRVLLREIAILFERWDEAMRRVRRTAAGEEGELRLGYIGPPTQPFLGRLLHEYRAALSAASPFISKSGRRSASGRCWRKGRLSAAFTRPVLTTERLGLADDPAAQGTLRRRGACRASARRARNPLRGASSRASRSSSSPAAKASARTTAFSPRAARAGFAPRLAYTPSLIGTVLSYVEAGAGVGIVPESVVTPELPLRFVPLTPAVTIPLVLVWSEDEDTPAGADVSANW